MIEEVTPTPIGGAPAQPATSPAPVAEPASVSEPAGSHVIVSEAEAEIEHLLQEVHDKIVALGGEHWITTISDELRQARASVEAAGEWIVEHFHKLGA